MQDAYSLGGPASDRRRKNWRVVGRAGAPALDQCGLAVLSAGLLLLAFPDFELWPLAWVGLTPLMVALLNRRAPRPPQAFFLGWLFATLFFYGSCYWLTHSMIHYGGLPAVLAFLLLIPGAMVVGLFPAFWSLAIAYVGARLGAGAALFAAPFMWAAFEWARLGVTGQLWNAVGYSQAYVPALIQPARWGGVYAVGFLIVTVSAALAFVILQSSIRRVAAAALAAALVALTLFLSVPRDRTREEAHPRSNSSSGGGGVSDPTGSNSTSSGGGVVVVAVQPNVPVNFRRTPDETAALVNRHLAMSGHALAQLSGGSPGDVRGGTEEERGEGGGGSGASLPAAATPLFARRRAHNRVVIWPESPMNFTYAMDEQFRETVAHFARANNAAVLFNSQEPAPGGGSYNSAVMVDEEGRLVAQYDKIRLLPFGEYVPLPRWLPASWLLTGIVGEFVPGEKYPLMPLGGGVQAGVFICIESAYPSISRTFARAGADVLVNISNDGYLGRTPVMRQHLANVVFRAVENNRPVIRATNTGISALITARGEVRDPTEGYEPAVRTWVVAPRGGDDNKGGGMTFYVRYGDTFAAVCALIGVAALGAAFYGGGGGGGAGGARRRRRQTLHHPAR